MFYTPEELIRLGVAEEQPNGSITITDFEAFEALPLNRMMTVVRGAYLKVSKSPNGKILAQDQVQKILSLWFSCTRSVSTSNPGFRSTKALKRDHHALGILKDDGSLDEHRIEKLAQLIWADPNHYPDFETLMEAQ